MDLVQNRDQWKAVVNMVMNLLVPYNAGKFLSSSTIGGFSRRAQLHEFSYNNNNNFIFEVTVHTHRCFTRLHKITF
jgi:hypothetical protein